ncbi:hydrophobin 2 [Mycena maculata]|uniref:Hydrophobin n=1 Tax=Mycena maculata TaxID=230809 RepID=A0AAD7JCC7_9AGAR|nr:hydrophobin 2 [Mycena maculata]
MFSDLSLVTLAAAIPSTPPPPVTPPTSSQCCSSLVPSSSSNASSVASLLGLDLTGLDVLVGIGCDPIIAISGLGLGCDGQISLECDAPDEEWGGLIAINCIPVSD